MAILHEMTRLAPPSFAVNPLVKLALVDQTYMQSLHYALWYTTMASSASGDRHDSPPCVGV